MNDLISVVLRTILVLIFLFILTKLMGKKQVSQLNIYDYLIGITIGSIAADISLDIEKNIISGLLCLAIYGLSDVAISILTQKSLKMRRLFTGTPTTLIENNKILESNLRKEKIDINDLQEQAREQGYFNLEDINFAILETSGKISFLPKTENTPATKKELNIKYNKESLVANIIIDGTLIENNLNNMNKDIKWLNQQLKIKGYKDYKKILLATLDNNEKLVIYPKNNDKDKKILE
jgi:uncharacterized membrane protein YcaP (DUF421 family)